MKELSIKEKAKAYDEALKVIKECSPDENGFITIYPQEIFPELKESDDEFEKNIAQDKTQSQWKPSEEQLKSLKEVIDVGHFTSYPNALETLYEQLKKLREE